MTRSAAVRGRGLVLGAFLALALALLRTSAADVPKRPLPDYDGRGLPPTPPGRALLWIPRVLLSPLYFTSEFLIRRPLGAFMTFAERKRLPRVLYDFFAFGPDHKAGFAPLVFVDFGFNPSVGVYAFWDGAFFDGNELRFHGSTWGADWLAGNLIERIRLGSASSLALSFTAVRRPDHAYWGTGPSSRERDLSRYGEDRLDGRALFDLTLGGASGVQAAVGVRSLDFRHGHYGHDPGVDQQVAAGVLPVPDGFDRGYTAETNVLRVFVDTRPSRAPKGSGLRLDLEAEQGNDLRPPAASGWLRYGATAGGFVDIGQHGRVVSFSVAALFADPLGRKPVPFTELVSLGGSGPMRGFQPGRLLDRSAAVA
ncbi:MAG: outer membrane protein assembly factor, partial [Myxococcota bacterium]|nr:outer membrane protein assembly factor [Myxococcota bacterium]